MSQEIDAKAADAKSSEPPQVEDMIQALPLSMQKEIEISLANVPEQHHPTVKLQLAKRMEFALANPFEPLAAACKANSIASLRMLIEIHGFDPFVIDQDSNSLLHICAWNHCSAPLKYLVEFVSSRFGAERAHSWCNSVNSTQATPLHWASMSGDIDSVKFLLAQRCTVEPKVCIVSVCVFCARAHAVPPHDSHHVSHRMRMVTLH